MARFTEQVGGKWILEGSSPEVVAFWKITFFDGGVGVVLGVDEKFFFGKKNECTLRLFIFPKKNFSVAKVRK